MKLSKVDAFPSDLDAALPRYSNFPSTATLVDDVIYTEAYYRGELDGPISSEEFESALGELPRTDGQKCVVLDGDLHVEGTLTLSVGLCVTGNVRCHRLVVEQYSYLLIGGTLTTDLVDAMTNDGVPIVVGKETQALTADMPAAHISQMVHVLRFANGALNVRKARELLKAKLREIPAIAVLAVQALMRMHLDGKEVVCGDVEEARRAHAQERWDDLEACFTPAYRHLAKLNQFEAFLDLAEGGPFGASAEQLREQVTEDSTWCR